LADTGDGPFLRTGDLGLVREGELFVTGRAKDLIIIRGRNHYPQDIELTVSEAHHALRPNGGAAFSLDVNGEERLVVVQEVDRHGAGADMGEITQLIRQVIAESHEVQTYAVVLVKAGHVPKTSSGKIRRRASRDTFLSGELAILYEWREETIYAVESSAPSFIEPQTIAELQGWLVQRLAERLHVAPSSVDVNQSITSYGLDSLAAIELAHCVQAELGVSLPFGRLLQGPPIAELAAEIMPSITFARGSRPSVSSSTAETGQQLCSQGQRALWFVQQLAPDNAAYNVAGAVRVKAALDVEALRAAFQMLVDRHALLRTTFFAVGGEPFQRIHDQREVSFEIVDAAGWSEDLLNERLAAESHCPFDLELGPLLRVCVFSRLPDEYVVLMTMHHIITDFWSMSILAEELGTLYEAVTTGPPVALPELKFQYSDFVNRQAELLDGPEGEALWTYWRGQLSGELPTLNLPTDRPRPRLQTYNGAAQAFTLNDELIQRLKVLSQKHDATLFMTLLAAFEILLSRQTGQDDFIVGFPTAGRSSFESAGTVGYFVNMLPLRADLSQDPVFGLFLDRVRQRVLEALAHEAYPFALLVERLQPERDPSRSPIFQVMFAFHQPPPGRSSLSDFVVSEASAGLHLGPLEVESISLPKRMAQFDLSLSVAETPAGFKASFEYNADLFEAETIARMVGHYTQLLGSIVANEEKRIAELELLTAGEREQLRVWSAGAGAGEWRRERWVHQLFEEQVVQRGAAVAVQDRAAALSYEELNERANQLAHYLKAAGVGPEVVVGVCLDRSVELVVAVLGVLKAGGAYVPLDPGYPEERLSYMVADAGAVLVVTQGAYRERFGERRVVLVDEEREAISGGSRNNPEVRLSGANLAYVIYTSGSTGKPKGVGITHGSVAVLVEWARGQYREEELAVVLAGTSLSFDLSSYELYVPLAAGQRVVVGENVLALRELGESAGVTLVNSVPSAVKELLREGEWPRTVRTVNLAGEALGREVVEGLYAQGVERVYNLYGPSDDTTYTTCGLMKQGEEGAPGIGRAIGNTQVYVLDGRQGLVATGEVGELDLCGAG
jgi:amino acid adenylation domain-containing protein